MSGTLKMGSIKKKSAQKSNKKVENRLKLLSPERHKQKRQSEAITASITKNGVQGSQIIIDSLENEYDDGKEKDIAPLLHVQDHEFGDDLRAK